MITDTVRERADDVSAVQRVVQGCGDIYDSNDFDLAFEHARKLFRL